MKITRVESYMVRVPLKPERRMVSALGRHDVSDYVVVRLSVDSGIEGVGEATVTPRWSGETVWGARAAIDRLLAPRLVGVDVNDVAEIDRRLDAAAVGNHFAKAALEMACWDVCGKAAGKPVYELLGGPCREHQVRCRFSLGAYEPERAARIAAERVAEGFTTIKVKVGGPVEDDLARVRAVREAIGPRVDLLVDANAAWDTATAIEALGRMADCRLVLVEQPTPRGDFAALATVRREAGLPVMADDICFDLADARELIDRQACDVISIYPGKQGGLRKAMAVASLAAEAGVACTIGSNLEWDIATSAMGQLVLAHPNVQVERYPGDMLGPVYHELRLARNPIRIEGPLVTVPGGPGLGIDVDWDAVLRSSIKA